MKATLRIVEIEGTVRIVLTPLPDQGMPTDWRGDPKCIVAEVSPNALLVAHHDLSSIFWRLFASRLSHPNEHPPHSD